MDKARYPTVGRRKQDLGRLAAAKVEAERRTGALRRGGGRARSLLAGKLVIDDGRMSFDCVIRNLSPRGARITLSSALELPPAVGLIIVREGLLCDAKVAWRRGDETGLTFLARHDLRTDTAPHRRFVRNLWASIAPQ